MRARWLLRWLVWRDCPGSRGPHSVKQRVRGCWRGSTSAGPSSSGRRCISRAELDVTNRFVLDFALAFARERGGARVLDYGCGAGRLVEAGLAEGLDIAGADVYYGGSATRAEAAAKGLLGGAIREMRGGA